MGDRKLIVGLGNPGPKYVGTRHNVGFAVIEEVARQGGADRVKQRFKGDFTEVRAGSCQVLLLRPTTFMNRSGSSVQAALDFFKLPLEDLLVVCDDMALDLGRIRFRAKGSSGGQKGLADIIQALGTDQFSRLRLGIGGPPSGWDAADYVLSSFGGAEKTEIAIAIQEGAVAVIDWVAERTEYCMNKYNGK